MNPSIDTILISDFQYDLPDEKIAHHPVEPRDSSKLLIYQEGKILFDHFLDIDQYIPEHALLIVNNSKVIEARLLFQNEQGSKVEIFCLQPFELEIQQAMTAANSCQWHCMIGGLKKWKETDLKISFKYDDTDYCFQAKKGVLHENGQVVQFSWNAPHLSFAEVLHIIGHVPLPPYIKRTDEKADQINYQTVYAQKEGSVAAPTAGLHFTDRVFQKLKTKHIDTLATTLHVGAGTFMPVKSERIQDHVMHAEVIEVDLSFIQALKMHQHAVIAVGTTSQRTLESIYWMGVKAIEHPQCTEQEIAVQQWDAYILKQTHSKKAALEALEHWMMNRKVTKLYTQTQLIILPTYTIRMTDAIITNFHQPKSTLLLLISAFVGDHWRNIYQEALKHSFRFLSYGDSSLLWKQNK